MQILDEFTSWYSCMLWFAIISLVRAYSTLHDATSCMAHALEYLKDLVLALKEINEKWLAENGKFFLVCANAKPFPAVRRQDGFDLS
jgi:hypothetical protein